ncbi:hypothetical protein QUF76_13295 [Desulfobacterales bacterium HSG16]|nr:hypothetical protein [Desulfobacterales bacterium HSG16]
MGNILQRGEYPAKVPVLMVLLNDHEGKLGRMIAENCVLSNELTEKDEQKFSNFIKNHNNQLIEDIIRQFSIQSVRNRIKRTEATHGKNRKYHIRFLTSG